MSIVSTPLALARCWGREPFMGALIQPRTGRSARPAPPQPTRHPAAAAIVNPQEAPLARRWFLLEEQRMGVAAGSGWRLKRIVGKALVEVLVIETDNLAPIAAGTR